MNKIHAKKNGLIFDKPIFTKKIFIL